MELLQYKRKDCLRESGRGLMKIILLALIRVFLIKLLEVHIPRKGSGKLGLSLLSWGQMTPFWACCFFFNNSTLLIKLSLRDVTKIKALGPLSATTP